MGRRFICSFLFFLFGTNIVGQVISISISNTEKDITTPITTVPTSTTSSIPIINPNSDPDSTSPASMTPTTTVTPESSSGGGRSWCIASPNASPTALQVGLDYACGYGGANCLAIQAGGSCYNPNTVRDHASYAFNNYYQKNPIPSSCNFGGVAISTNADPSSGTCHYPSTSTSSSILNTTNSNGATIYGAVPSSPSSPTPSAAKINNTTNSFSMSMMVTLFFMLMLRPSSCLFNLIA